jgi:hypothetical protein
MSSRVKKPVALAILIVAFLFTGGVALAYTASDPKPSTGSETTKAHSDETDESESDDTESDDTESEAPDTDAPDGESSSGEHADNHGAAVSQAAHDCPPGPGHGACVSAVAHSDAGKKPHKDK